MVRVKRSFNKLLLVLLAGMFLFQPIQALAVEPILDSEKLEEEKKPGIIEKHLSKLIINAGNWLIDLSNAQDVSVLVFQRPEIAKEKDEVLPNRSSANRDSMFFGIFPSGLFDGISAFNSFFTSLLPIPMVILLTGGGLFLLFDIMRSNETRSKVKEVLFGVVSAILMVRFGHILWGWIIDINYILVDGIYTVLKKAGIEITRFSNTIWDSSKYADLTASQTIGVAILLICAIFMTFTINYQYMMRMIQLSMLIVLFPFVVLSSIIPSRKSVLNLWFTTFVSNVFMQAGHAVALGLFFYTIAKANELSFWLVMTMLFGLPAMADIVNRLAGAFTGEGGGGGVKTSASNMSGMAGLMAISKIGQTIAGSKRTGNQADTRKTEASSSEHNGAGPGNFTPTKSNLSADSSITHANGTAPLGSTLQETKSHSMAANSSKNGSTSGMSRRAQAMNSISSFAKGASKAGRYIATSDKAKGVIRSSAVVASAATGAIAGTMTTGSGGGGAFVGSQVGRSVGTAGNYAREKLGKGIQHGGELISGAIDQHLGKVDTPLTYTQQRLDYTDNAQLYDPQEMGRMGEELIGGKTGKTLGTAAGAINNFAGRTFGGPEKKEAVARVSERKSLGEQINQSKAIQNQAKGDLDTAKLQHNVVSSQFGPQSTAGQQWKAKKQSEFNLAQTAFKENPDNQKYRQRYEKAKENLNQPHPEYAKSQRSLQQKEAAYNQSAFQTRQLEQKQANFYRIQKQAEEMKTFQSEVRSSGRL